MTTGHQAIGAPLVVVYIHIQRAGVAHIDNPLLWHGWVWSTQCGSCACLHVRKGYTDPGCWVKRQVFSDKGTHLEDPCVAMLAWCYIHV